MMLVHIGESNPTTRCCFKKIKNKINFRKKIQQYIYGFNTPKLCYPQNLFFFFLGYISLFLFSIKLITK